MAKKPETDSTDDNVNATVTSTTAAAELETTNTDVNATTETVAGPSVEDPRAGLTGVQKRLDQNVPAGGVAEFDPARMGLDPAPYGKAAK